MRTSQTILSRNCMNVVLNRTNHAGYHLGQLMFLARTSGLKFVSDLARGNDRIHMARAATTTDVFNAIAEPRRRQIIRLLRDREEWTVGEIASRMKMAQSTASRHLHVLKEVGVVTAMKRGRFMCYRLHPASLNSPA